MSRRYGDYGSIVREDSPGYAPSTSGSGYKSIGRQEAATEAEDKGLLSELGGREIGTEERREGG